MADFLIPPTLNFGLCDEKKFDNVRPMYLQWRRPPPGFFAINCDGSFRALNGTGGYGVVVRDDLGRFILAKANHFQKDDLEVLKNSSEVAYGVIVLMTEMMAIRDGLQLAKQLGMKHVEVQSDSKISISILVGNAKCPKQCLGILSEIKLELNFFRGVGFRFIFRERNRAADFLSKFLRSNEEKFFTLSQLPYQLQKIILDDCLGFSVLRM